MSPSLRKCSRRSSSPMEDLMLERLGTVYCNAPYGSANIARALALITRCKEACAKARTGIDTREIEDNQAEIDAALRQITCASGNYEALKQYPPPAMFEGIPDGAPADIVGAAKKQVKEDWIARCEDMKKNPAKYLHQDHAVHTAGDYVYYFMAQRAAGMTELSVAPTITVEGK